MNLLLRKASVRWKSGLKGGTRSISTRTGVLNRVGVSLRPSLKKEFHTDPAELMAAAHASSFSLALSDELKLKARDVGEILTTATVTLQRLAPGWTIKNIHLDVRANLPRVTSDRFINATVRAKLNCAVSRELRANISMNAQLKK